MKDAPFRPPLALVATIGRIFLLAALIFGAGCVRVDTPTPAREDAVTPPPTPPRTVPELIDVLLNGSEEARVGAARRLGQMGDSALDAIPALSASLSHSNSEVREAAAWALGQMGSSASSSVNALSQLITRDVVARVRMTAADSLGLIGAKSAIPALAEGLQDNEVNVNISSARSIGLITEQDFPDMNSSGFSLNESGVPLIVVAAREWWASIGQHQEWNDN